MERKFILAIDGGGVRGVIPLVLLAKLEKETGKLTRDIFQFVGGTSTGAIIAAGIATGMPAKDILQIYLTRSRQLFKVYPWTFLKRFLFGYAYSNENLYNIIAEEMSNKKDWHINDSPVDLLITAKRLDGVPFYFVKDNPKNTKHTGGLSLASCATASASAPTYFRPWMIDGVGLLVDGGVGVAGNPVYQACVEAFYYTDKYAPSNTTVVSLGTGGRFPVKREPQWLPDWLGWILNELFTSPGEQQTELVHRHFPQATFYRLDPNLQALDPALKRDIPLDAVSMLDTLRLYGEKFAELVDWQAILASRDTAFCVRPRQTIAPKYMQPQI